MSTVVTVSITANSDSSVRCQEKKKKKPPCSPPCIWANMLITLCYVYLWVRFHRCYSVLIRNSLLRLNRSRFSFTFSLCSSPASAPQPAGPRILAHRHPSPHPREEQDQEERVFLQLGDKAVYVTEPQVSAVQFESLLIQGLPVISCLHSVNGPQLVTTGLM